ncbi:PD-(D/E)XK nuclease family protein [Enterococcus sp. AZ109]|uniref:PD-(D/E)XK nuclease family protein n=1 Tax=Enterococcus sp. AZ109 TaxID=2774634 RepID=UPI003F1F0838
MVNILGIEGKETYITNWFAYLIDPNTFSDPSILKNILELYNENLRQVEKIKINSFSNVEVNTEVSLAEYGIIDILITMDECIIGIENKIYSGLGVNQLERYSMALKKGVFRKGNNYENKKNELPILKILLTPRSNKAEPKAEFVKITYEEIVDKLDNTDINWKLNDRNSIHLRDFITYINEYIREEEKVTSKDWNSFLVQNYKDLKTIYEQGELALGNLRRLIEQKIGKMNATNEEEIWSIGNKGNGKNANNFWIQAYFSDWNTHRVHYEFIFPKATKGFLIPKELVLNLDVELKETRDILQEIGFGSPKNEISRILLDPNDISRSLDKLFEVLKRWHKENFTKIDAKLKKMKS